MEYLFSHRNKLKDRLKDKFVLLFLDYDGTLTPIVETPDKAVISKERKDLLDKLSTSSHYRVAIISGRSLNDIKGLVGLKDIIYAGNHGLEIEGPKIKFESHVSLRLKSVIRNIAEELSKRLSSIKGVLIEDKGLTLSIHYRLVDKKNIPQVKTIFHETVILYLVRNKIKIKTGKMVLEVRPSSEWDKGKVVLWLLARQQFALGEKRVFPVYIGDDVTDEDAFKVLKRKGLTVFVGEPGSSKADYYVKDPEEVTQFLRLILDLKHN